MIANGSHHRVTACRICGSDDLDVFLDLGTTPLANAFVAPERITEPEPRFPLEVMRCLVCGLAQLSVVVAPEVMFQNYLYASSASAPMLAHFDALAEDLVARFAPRDSLVVEIGSNDGVLLRPLKERGVRALGIEPASNIARLANEAGLETWNAFFSYDAAAEVREERGRARVVVANNVVAHIDALAEVARAIEHLLDNDGVFVAEVPYLADLLDHVEYDTVYHEHLSYFHLAPLQRLFADVGMELFDVRRLEIHGGSVRVFAGRRGRHPRTRQLEELVTSEARLARDDIFRGFAKRVDDSRGALRTMLDRLGKEGRSIAALGATAKGNTLLNYCGIGPQTIAFIADSTPLKQGLLTPGTHIPVRAEHALDDERPNCALLLAWNYADAIMRRHAEYISSGGRFIHPIPLARLLPP
ncbi:MAG TPA: class I SAM-dependent methyltransferase [Candidatus Limnocylindria bacterium]|nr:class I SAM-dependent methyltransferase [Candidatus Limnocylindria bacterium]